MERVWSQLIGRPHGPPKTCVSLFIRSSLTSSVLSAMGALPQAEAVSNGNSQGHSLYFEAVLSMSHRLRFDNHETSLLAPVS